MPEPPAEGVFAHAYLVGAGDGWDLRWTTDELLEAGDSWADPGGHVPDLEWPFGIGEVATSEDFEALGFKTV